MSRKQTAESPPVTVSRLNTVVVSLPLKDSGKLESKFYIEPMVTPIKQPKKKADSDEFSDSGNSDASSQAVFHHKNEFRVYCGGNGKGNIQDISQNEKDRKFLARRRARIQKEIMKEGGPKINPNSHGAKPRKVKETPHRKDFRYTKSNGWATINEIEHPQGRIEWPPKTDKKIPLMKTLNKNLEKDLSKRDKKATEERKRAAARSPDKPFVFRKATPLHHSVESAQDRPTSARKVAATGGESLKDLQEKMKSEFCINSDVHIAYRNSAGELVYIHNDSQLQKVMSGGV